jgi:hypothetical protein
MLAITRISSRKRRLERPDVSRKDTKRATKEGVAARMADLGKKPDLTGALAQASAPELQP